MSKRFYFQQLSLLEVRSLVLFKPQIGATSLGQGGLGSDGN